MRKDFYIYEHWRPDKDVCFYVGKGCGRRSKVLYARGMHHERIARKLIRLGMPIEVRVVCKGLSETKAFILETKRIAYWRSIGIKLINRTDGGEGPSGYKMSISHKRMLLIANKGRSRPTEVREKISKSLTGRKYSLERCLNISKGHKGKTISEDHRRKISISLKRALASPEVREKIRQRSLGKKKSQHFCDFMSKLHKGKKVSEETKDKIRRARAKQVIKHSESAKLNMSIAAKKRCTQRPVVEGFD